METEAKQVVEKKVYEDGRKNYATKGEALGIGIPALVLGGLAVASLWERGRTGGVPENVNINTTQAGGGSNSAPTAFDSWRRECDDMLALTNELWELKLNTEREMYSHREKDVEEKHALWRNQIEADFRLYKSQVDADFGLYKNQRDMYDALNAKYADKFAEIDKKVAVMEATRPYQDRLIQCGIREALTTAINYTDRKTCRAIYGVVGLPSTPTVTVLEGANPFGCNPAPTQTPAAGA